MLQDPISMYEAARRRHLERLAEGSRRQALRGEHPRLRRAIAAVLRRAADAVDGGATAWRTGAPLEDA